jgi:hypothetical protein
MLGGVADPGTPRTDRTRFVLASIVALVGLVWALQAPASRSAGAS